MPGFLLHVGATVPCAHGGQAQPAAPSTRVRVGGQPVVTIASAYLVAGCALPSPPAGNGPCVSARFVAAAQRVAVMGQPVLLQDSQSICEPTGTPLLPRVTQTRVSAI
jgi:hypothetical protein